ncbi:MAG: hypothetical protein ACLP8B_24335, partial [Xanthobacteraceae bacterium]
TGTQHVVKIRHFGSQCMAGARTNDSGNICSENAIGVARSCACDPNLQFATLSRTFGGEFRLRGDARNL